jgi:hypothetical protein
LVATWIKFLWCFVLLVRFSEAVPQDHGAVLGALLVTATLIMLSEVVRSIFVDVWADAKNRRDEARGAGADVEPTPVAPTESAAVDLADTRIIQVTVSASVGDSERLGPPAPSGFWDAGSLGLCGDLAPSDPESAGADANDAIALAQRNESLVKQLAQKDGELRAARALIPEQRNRADGSLFRWFGD